MHRCFIVVLALAFITSCSTASFDDPARGPATPELAYGLAEEIASAARALDVDALMRRIPRSDKVVYVSNGTPITGNEYRETIGRFYASLTRLEWTWDRWEASVISRDAVTFTGWATAVATPREGPEIRERTIHTMLFVRERDGWKRVISHKTNLP
jgi:hypothetical protein